MKFYLIYQYKGIPVDVSSFDDEESQMKQFLIDSNKPDYQQHIRYDSVHILNIVN